MTQLPTQNLPAPAADIQPATPAGYTAADAGLSTSTRERLARARPDSTTRAYAYARRQFTEWCDTQTRVPLPCTPQTLVDYVNHLMDLGRAPATINQAVAAIRTRHAEAGYQKPAATAVIEAMRTYRRDRATEGRREQPAEALRIGGLRTIVNACPDNISGVRDRALLVLGWAMMGRRSELVNLTLDDQWVVDEGLLVLIRRSKTDQDAVGHEVAIPYGSHLETCPVRLVGAWTDTLAGRGITAGPLFRSIDRHGRLAGEPAAAGRAGAGLHLDPTSIWHILRRAALRAGVPTTNLSPHSLRSGGATGAREGGADILAISRQGRWKDGSPTVYRYLQAVDRWKGNPMAGSGL